MKEVLRSSKQVVQKDREDAKAPHHTSRHVHDGRGQGHSEVAPSAVRRWKPLFRKGCHRDPSDRHNTYSYGDACGVRPSPYTIMSAEVSEDSPSASLSCNGGMTCTGRESASDTAAARRATPTAGSRSERCIVCACVVCLCASLLKLRESHESSARSCAVTSRTPYVAPKQDCFVTEKI